jgi:hypothetical protein
MCSLLFWYIFHCALTKRIALLLYRGVKTRATMLAEMYEGKAENKVPYFIATK